eukprot:4660583-Amphidinium_carterae.1
MCQLVNAGTTSSRFFLVLTLVKAVVSVSTPSLKQRCCRISTSLLRRVPRLRTEKAAGEYTSIQGFGADGPSEPF